MQTRQKLSAAIAFSTAYLASDYYHYQRGSTFFRSTVWRPYFEKREQKAQPSTSQPNWRTLRRSIYWATLLQLYRLPGKKTVVRSNLTVSHRVFVAMALAWALIHLQLTVKVIAAIISSDVYLATDYIWYKYDFQVHTLYGLGQILQVSRAKGSESARVTLQLL